MCQFKHWFFDDNGYVVQCEACGYFQLSFGTTMLTLDNTNYTAFVKLVATTKESHVPMKDKNVKCIVLPTPSTCIHNIFTENEFEHLHSMLQEADTEIKTHQLLSLFNQA